jgi:hypothetical protein
MAQTFGMTAENTWPKKITAVGTSSNGGRSSPDKVFDATWDTKKNKVHLDDPNEATPIESSTPIV